MKNQSFCTIALVAMFSMSSVLFSADTESVPVAPQENIAVPLVDDSGKDRIVHIMSQTQHDIVHGNENLISYAQTCNVNTDLNIKEIANFFDCKTVMGNAFLKECLSRPVSPTDKSGIVALRKNIITQLIENSDFKQQVEAILEIAMQQEKTVVELMSDTFRGKCCPIFEELQQLKAADGSIDDVFYYWINNLVTNEIWATRLYAANLYSIGYLLFETGRHGKNAFHNDAKAAFMASMNGLAAALCIYGEYHKYLEACKKREAMHALNQLICAAESIEKLSGDHNIATQFKISLIHDGAGLSMIFGLKAWRYQNKKDDLFNVPAVDTFLYKVYENEAQLAQIFASIAELDACNAIATKMLKGQTSHHKFCFAQEIESTQPQLISTGFWNVLVPNAVINDLPMNQSVILTGPNAGGKSTLIRANLQNIALAQTFGVAAAAEFAWTPFDVLLSYLNISDDLINGYSLFASEIKRAQEILGFLRGLIPGQKLFFALDELFTGTAAAQGEKCAYEFIKKTAGFDQALFIYATHFDKLTELGDQNIGLMNYKVDAPIKNDAGRFVYPFTLSDGINDVNIALEMAQDADLF